MKSIDYKVHSVHSKPKQTHFFRGWTDLHKESALRKSLFAHPFTPQRWRGQILPSKSLKRRRPRHPWFLQTRSVTRIHRVGSVHFPRCFQVSYLSVCVWENNPLSTPLSLSLSESFCARDGEAGGCCLRKRAGGARASSHLHTDAAGHFPAQRERPLFLTVKLTEEKRLGIRRL